VIDAGDLACHRVMEELRHDWAQALRHWLVTTVVVQYQQYSTVRLDHKSPRMLLLQ
jgi:hypothetical protein